MKKISILLVSALLNAAVPAAAQDAPKGDDGKSASLATKYADKVAQDLSDA